MVGSRDIHHHPAEPQLLAVPSKRGAQHKLSALLFAACPAGTFKASQGAGLCAPCPPNSRSSAEASPLCACRNGYYRADLDPPAAACTSEYWGGEAWGAGLECVCTRCLVPCLAEGVFWGRGEGLCLVPCAVRGISGVVAMGSSLIFGEERAQERRKDCWCSSACWERGSWSQRLLNCPPKIATD